MLERSIHHIALLMRETLRLLYAESEQPIATMADRHGIATSHLAMILEGKRYPPLSMLQAIEGDLRHAAATAIDRTMSHAQRDMETLGFDR